MKKTFIFALFILTSAIPLCLHSKVCKHEDVNIIGIDTIDNTVKREVYYLLKEFACNGKSSAYDLRIYSDSVGNTYLMLSETSFAAVRNSGCKYKGICLLNGNNTETYFFVNYPDTQSLADGRFLQIFSETGAFVDIYDIAEFEMKQKTINKDLLNSGEYHSVDGDDFYLGLWIDGELETIRKHIAGTLNTNPKYNISIK